jgi:hypothetical protein
MFIIFTAVFFRSVMGVAWVQGTVCTRTMMQGSPNREPTNFLNRTNRTGILIGGFYKVWLASGIPAGLATGRSGNHQNTLEIVEMLWKFLEILWKFLKYFRNCKLFLKILEIMCDFIFHFLQLWLKSRRRVRSPLLVLFILLGSPTVCVARALRQADRQGAPVLPLRDLRGRARDRAF